MNKKKILRGRKIRLLPTLNESKLLFEISECYRKTWNWALKVQMKCFERRGAMMNWNELSKIYTKYLNSKSGKELRNVSVKYIKTALIDLHNSYERFFRMQRNLKQQNLLKYSKKVIVKCLKENRKPTTYELMYHPKFKSRNKCKINFGCSDGIFFNYNKKSNKFEGISLYKVDNLIQLKTEYMLPIGKKPIQVKQIHNPRISYQHGKWIFSYAVEIPVKDVRTRKYNLGIDLGIRKEAVIAFGNQIMKFSNINKSPYIKRLERKLKHIQRNISRKLRFHKKGTPYSKGLKDEIKKLNKLYYHLRNIRHNYIHHITRKIINLLPAIIVYENLNISGMMKNRYLSRHIANAIWYEFRRQIEYKVQEYSNIQLLVADRWYPSSKLCNNCGNKKSNLGFNETYKCDKCGLVIDRDFNAAKNLMSLA